MTAMLQVVFMAIGLAVLTFVIAFLFTLTPCVGFSKDGRGKMTLQSG